MTQVSQKAISKVVGKVVWAKGEPRLQSPRRPKTRGVSLNERLRPKRVARAKNKGASLNKRVSQKQETRALTKDTDLNEGRK